MYKPQQLSIPLTMSTCIVLPIARDETADIETLVDDFITFYIAGEAVCVVEQ